VFSEVCISAQRKSALLEQSPWAVDHIYRGALLNRLIGTARWGFTGDGLLSRGDEVAAQGLYSSTTHEQQNQGRYYWIAPDVGMVFTIRRKAHEDPDHVGVLQLQIEGLLEQTTRSFPQGATVVYLAVPPLGKKPAFEVAVKGKVRDRYTLEELLHETPAAEPGSLTQRDAGRRRRRVSSKLVPDDAEKGGVSGDDG
jgi:hypothetical protein